MNRRYDAREYADLLQEYILTGANTVQLNEYIFQQEDGLSYSAVLAQCIL